MTGHIFRSTHRSTDATHTANSHSRTVQYRTMPHASHARLRQVRARVPPPSHVGAHGSRPCRGTSDPSVDVGLVPGGARRAARWPSRSHAGAAGARDGRALVENASLLAQERPAIGMGGQLVRSWPVASRSRERAELPARRRAAMLGRRARRDGRARVRSVGGAGEVRAGSRAPVALPRRPRTSPPAGRPTLARRSRPTLRRSDAQHTILTVLCRSATWTRCSRRRRADLAPASAAPAAASSAS